MPHPELNWKKKPPRQGIIRLHGGKKKNSSQKAKTLACPGMN